MKLKSIITLSLGVALLWSCSSVSTLKNSWTKTDYSFKADPAKKVLLVAIAKDEAIRNQVEDQMKASLVGKGAEISTSYRFVKYGTKPEALVEYIELGNFSHIITMRLADVEKEIEYRPGGYYAGGYYGYYPTYYGYYGNYFGRVWSTTYVPGSYQENVEYTLETNVYSTKDKELVYSAMTSTFKGSGLDNAITATLQTIAEDLRKKGLVSEN